jgi:hypothetical protein
LRKNKVTKISISLLIALAFIMPMNAIANETDVKESSSIHSGSQYNLDKESIQSALQLCEISVVDLINFTDPMATGCYDLTVELEKCCLEPIECDVKIFLDIWKAEEPPAEEIYCTDFEDTGDIYNNWEAWDGPSGDSSSPDGAIDTWSWSDARSHSPGHSMHSSMFDTYLGNQNDYLVLYLPLDGEYEDLKLTFWHWMEGEVLLIDEDETEEIVDWGMVQYSYDGMSWTDLSPRYYDNATWDEITLWIDDSGGEDDIFIRWYWHTNPCCQFEGWYIDDVCLYGYEDAGWGTRVFDTYTPHAITLPADPLCGLFTYTFDEQYCFDEGNYSIRVWLLSETLDCEVLHPQADPFWFNFTVDDIYDIAVTYNSFYLTDSPCLEGGDLIVEGTVCNVGTLDAENVQVTFSVYEIIYETVFESLIEEEDFSDWTTSWQSGGNDTGTYISDDIDLFVTEVDSFSPTHAWTNVNETTGHVRHQYAGIFTPEVDVFDGDPKGMDFTMRWKYEVRTGHWLQPAFIADTYLWDVADVSRWTGSSWVSRWPVINGDAGTVSQGWTTVSFSELITTYTNYWEDRYFGELGGFLEFINALDGRYGPDGMDVEDFSVITLGTYYEAEIEYSGSGYSGMYLDDFKVVKSYQGAERYSETIIIPELLVGECEDVEFVWEGVPTGNFIECKSVPHDDNDDNNELCGEFSVWTDIDCAIEENVEAVDLTEAENHWTICSSGYDSYFATGDCQYGPDWLDPLVLAPEEDGDETTLDRISIDLSGADTFTLEFDDYFQGESPDYGMIEINPYVSDPDGADYAWYQYIPAPTVIAMEDFSFGLGIFTNIIYSGGSGWITQPYGANWVGDDMTYLLPSGGVPPDYAIADSDAILGGLHAGMVAGPFDLSAYPAFVIDYVFMGRLCNYGETAQVRLWSGPGMANYEGVVDDWSGMCVFGTGGSTVSTGGLVDPSNVYIEFYFDDHGVWGWWWMLDEFQLTTVPAPAPPAQMDYDWTHQVLTFDEDVHLGQFINPQNGNSFLSDIGSEFTDDMGIALVFYSDDDVQYRGWLIDDFTLMADSTVLIDADPGEDFDQLYGMPRPVGNYWAFISGSPDYWQCKEQIVDLLPHNLNNALVWDTSVPQAMAATLTFEHEFDLLDNDYCYLEFSTDGGSNWIAPTRFTGATSGWEEIELDMTSYVGDNVLIRWRVVTNETFKSSYYRVREMCIVAQVDLNAPTTTGTLSGTSIFGWYSSAVTFTATATDDVSGVDATYYKIDGGSTLRYTGPVTISTNGEHQIEYWSVDNVGNEEVHKFTPVFKIDRGSAPSISITAPEPGIYLFGNQILGIGSKPIIIGGFTVQATASDADSGVYRLQFLLDGTLFGEDTEPPFAAYCGVKHTGAGTITVIAEDFVGNSAQDTLDVTYFKFL